MYGTPEVIPPRARARAFRGTVRERQPVVVLLRGSASVPLVSAFLRRPLAAVIFVDMSYTWANRPSRMPAGTTFYFAVNERAVYVGRAEWYYNKVSWNDRKVQAANNSLSRRVVGRSAGVLGFAASILLPGAARLCIASDMQPRNRTSGGSRNISALARAEYEKVIHI